MTENFTLSALVIDFLQKSHLSNNPEDLGLSSDEFEQMEAFLYTHDPHHILARTTNECSKTHHLGPTLNNEFIVLIYEAIINHTNSQSRRC